MVEVLRLDEFRTNGARWQARQRRLALHLEELEQELEEERAKSPHWQTFRRACASGPNHYYSLRRIAAYVGLRRDGVAFCDILACCAPEWLADLAWDGDDQIGPHHLGILSIELGARDLLSEDAADQIGEVALAEVGVMCFQVSDTFRDASLTALFVYEVGRRWCERRKLETTSEA